jgi:hypothetical protein
MKIQNPSRHFKKNKKVLKNKEDLENNTDLMNKEFLNGKQRDANDKAKYFNNASVSDKHGQENIESSLVILAIQILFTALLVYIYFNNLGPLIVLLFIITGIFDIIVLTFYIYFVIKFKKEEIFTSLPKTCFSVSDVFNIANMLLKSINYVFIFIFSDEVEFWFTLNFTIKYFIDLYFFLTSIKIYMFCPCGIWLNDVLCGIWNWIKYYIFCCEIEETNSDMEYSRMEDMESFY